VNGAEKGGDTEHDDAFNWIYYFICNIMKNDEFDVLFYSLVDSDLAPNNFKINKDQFSILKMLDGKLTESEKK